MRYGQVYFICADEAKSIKIGYTDGTVTGRLSTIQSGSPVKLRLLATITASEDTLVQVIEERLHRKFAHLRLSGEWFYAADELLEFIRHEAEPFGNEQLGLLSCDTPEERELSMEFMSLVRCAYQTGPVLMERISRELDNQYPDRECGGGSCA